jgi:phospholipid/cholesterol/gamma-HCH transport system ATP-binding protein
LLPIVFLGCCFIRIDDKKILNVDNLLNNEIIKVRNLKAAFGESQVLSGVSFTVYKNQITVILGGSGSGKTTVLKHLIGLYPVLEGEVVVLGKNMGVLEEEQQENLYHRMGVFFQNGALLNSMTVAENIALPIEQHAKLSGKLLDELVRLKLRLVNLSHAYHLYPSQLSGGMLKRAALARAIAMDPPLLFCDEPGAGLDPISLAALDRLILNLKNQLGITIVLVTHEVSSILRLADRVIFLDKGKVVFEGTLTDALSSKIDLIKAFFP